MTIKLSKSVYPDRSYLVPTIELKNPSKGYTSVCVSFLKWCIGVCVNMQEG